MVKYYQTTVNELIDTFSRIESGTAFDFIINTSETVFSDLKIEKGDVIIASVNDFVYFKFDVVEKTTNELQLKKSFEIQKSISHTISEIGIIEEISENEYDSICNKLFSEYRNINTQPVKRNDFDNLKQDFADWFIKLEKSLAKFGQVYKST